MRSRVTRLILAVVALAALGACAAQETKPTVDRAAITATIDSLDRAFSAAVAARDIEAVLGFYTDDALVLPPGAPAASGKEAFRAVWTSFLATPGLDMRLQTGRVEVSEAGDMAVGTGAYTMSFTGPTGTTMQDAGKFMAAFKRTDAGWRIVADMWNSDLAPGQ